MTRDIPIIFSAPMVRALIEGRKTMTRRLAWGKSRPLSEKMPGGRIKTSIPGLKVQDTYSPASPWQKVKAGDRLWVRENLGFDFVSMRPTYVAGEHEFVPNAPPEFCGPCAKYQKSRPSIHMPRWASRLTLIVTATKIEKLQDIPLRDVVNEGCEVRQFWLFGADGPERQKIGARVFGNLWEELHGRESWDANPLVVALTFRVIRANIDSEKAQP